MAKRRKDEEYQEPEYTEPEPASAEPLSGDPPEPDDQQNDADREAARIEAEAERVKEEREIDPATVAPTTGGPQVYRMEKTGGVRGETIEKGETVILTPEEAARLATGGVQLSWNPDDQLTEEQQQDVDVNRSRRPSAELQDQPEGQPDPDEMPSSDPPRTAPAKGPSYRR